MRREDPFSPKYYVESDAESEMRRMHTPEYIASLDAEDIHNDDSLSVISSQSSEHVTVTPDHTSESSPLSFNDRVLQEIRDGYFMHAGELTSLTVEAARLLTARSFLDLRGVTDLPFEVAAELGTHKGRLILSGLTRLEEGVADALGRHEGYLDLAGITHLSFEEARALNRQKGDLRLSELILDFSHAHAEESARLLDVFADHQGEVILSPFLQKQFESYKKQHTTI